MKIRLMSIMLMALPMAIGVPPTLKDQSDTMRVNPPEPVVPPRAPAPVVSMIFGNESGDFEIVFTLAHVGDYFSNKNAGTYYPQFLPVNGKIARETFTFDPGALGNGPDVYPFMFTFKGDIYYVVFVTTKILNEKTDFPFFATIVKIIDLQEKTNSASIQTIANLFFRQNDTLALGMLANKLEFYNITQKTKAAFVADEKELKVTRVLPRPKPKAQLSNQKNVPLKSKKPPLVVRPMNRVTPAVPPRKLSHAFQLSKLT